MIYCGHIHFAISILNCSTSFNNQFSFGVKNSNFYSKLNQFFFFRWEYIKMCVQINDCVCLIFTCCQNHSYVQDIFGVTLGSYIWLQVSIEKLSHCLFNVKPPLKIHTCMENIAQGNCLSYYVKWKLGESKRMGKHIWEMKPCVQSTYHCFGVLRKRKKYIWLTFDKDKDSVWNACKFVCQSHPTECRKLGVQIWFQWFFFLFQKIDTAPFRLNEPNKLSLSFGLFIWLIIKVSCKMYIDSWFTFE